MWPKKYGIMCLSIWLILNGMMVFVSGIRFSAEILGILAIAAGVLLWLDR